MKIYSLVFISILLFISSSYKLKSRNKHHVLLSEKKNLKQNQCSTSGPAEGCVWLFEDYVTKVEVCDDTPNLGVLSFDKLPLSIQLGENTKVTLFSDYNYAGGSRVFNTSGSYQLLDFLCQTSSVLFHHKEIYTIRGYIKNALTGKVFSSSDVSSGSITVIFTDSNGNQYPATIIPSNSTYYVELPALGTYSRNGTMTGKVATGTTISVAGSTDETTSANTVYFSEIIKGWRAVLSWNTVTDMDTFVLNPQNVKVWYRKKTDGSVVTLDVDDRTGAGPETLTFNFDSSSSGSYKYYINNYRNLLPLNATESKVVVYHGAYQIAEITPPQGQTPLAYWYVFRIDANKGTEEYVEQNTYVKSI